VDLSAKLYSSNARNTYFFHEEQLSLNDANKQPTYRNTVQALWNKDEQQKIFASSTHKTNIKSLHFRIRFSFSNRKNYSTVSFAFFPIDNEPTTSYVLFRDKHEKKNISIYYTNPYINGASCLLKNNSPLLLYKYAKTYRNYNVPIA